MKTAHIAHQENIDSLRAAFYKIIHKKLEIPAPHLIEKTTPPMSRHTKEDIDEIIVKLNSLDLSAFKTKDEIDSAVYIMFDLLSRHIKNHNIILPDFISLLYKKIPDLNTSNFDSNVSYVVEEYIRETASFIEKGNQNSLFYKDSSYSDKCPIIDYVNPQKILQLCHFGQNVQDQQRDYYYDNQTITSFLLNFINNDYLNIYYKAYASDIDQIMSLALTEILSEHAFGYNTEEPLFSFYNPVLCGKVKTSGDVYQKVLKKIVELNCHIAKNPSINSRDIKDSIKESSRNVIKNLYDISTHTHHLSSLLGPDPVNQTLAEIYNLFHIQAFHEMRQAVANNTSILKSDSSDEMIELATIEFKAQYKNMCNQIKNMSDSDFISKIETLGERTLALPKIKEIREFFYCHAFCISVHLEDFSSAKSILPGIIDAPHKNSIIAEDLFFALHKPINYPNTAEFEDLVEAIFSLDAKPDNLLDSLNSTFPLQNLDDYRLGASQSIMDKKEKIKEFNKEADDIFSSFLEAKIISPDAVNFLKWYLLYTEKSGYEFIDFLLVTQNVKSIEILSLNKSVADIVSQRAEVLYTWIQTYNGQKLNLKHKLKKSTFNAEYIDKIHISKNLVCPNINELGNTAKTSRL